MEVISWKVLKGLIKKARLSGKGSVEGASGIVSGAVGDGILSIRTIVGIKL